MRQSRLTKTLLNHERQQQQQANPPLTAEPVSTLPMSPPVAAPPGPRRRRKPPQGITIEMLLAQTTEATLRVPGTLTPAIAAGMPGVYVQAEANALADQLGICHPVALGGFLYGTVVYVSPALAYKWFKLHSTRNRNLIPAQLAKLQADLRTGKWFLTHQGGAFGPDGFNKDGQHRLAAILREGITAPMLIVFNISTEAQRAIDTVQRRRAHDTDHIAGGDISRNEIAIARRVYEGITLNFAPWSNQECLDATRRHLTAIRWVCDRLGKSDTKLPAAVRAAVVRAWYHVDHAVLDKFCCILATGTRPGGMDPFENSAVYLREWVQNDSRRYRGRPGASPATIYAKTCRGIKAYVNEENVETFQPVKTELWELPTDEQIAALTGQ